MQYIIENELLTALKLRNAEAFAKILLDIGDPFWESHATLTGTPLASPCRLIGEERVQDILINVFWPLVSLDDPEAAARGLREIKAAASKKSRSGKMVL